MPRNVDFTPTLEKLGAFADAGDPRVVPNQNVAASDPQQGFVDSLTIRAAGADALNLARSLQGLDRNVSQVAGVLEQQARRQEKENRRLQAIAGRDLGNSVLASEGAKAVQLGILPENAHPLFVQNFNETVGRNAAFQYNTDINSLYAQAQKDGLDIDEFLRENRSKVLDSIKEPTQRDTFLRLSQGFENNIRAAQNSFLVQETRRKAIEASSSEILNLSQQYIDTASAAGEGVDLEKLFAIQENTLRRAGFSGMRPEDLTAVRRSTIINLALQNEDLSILDLGNKPVKDVHGTQVLPGVGTSAEGKTLMNNARQKILGLQRQRVDFQYKTRERQRKTGERLAITQLGQLLSKDPSVVLSDQQKNFYRAMIPDFDTFLRKRRKLFIETPNLPAKKEDLDKINFLIKTGSVDIQDLFDAVGPDGFTHRTFGNIRVNPGQFDALSSSLTEQMKLNNTGNNPFSFPDYKKAVDTYLNSILPPRDPFSKSGYAAGVSPESARKARALQTELRREFFEVYDRELQQDPNLINNPRKRIRILSDIQKELSDKNAGLFESTPTQSTRMREEFRTEAFFGQPVRSLRQGLREYQNSGGKEGIIADEIRRIWPSGTRGHEEGFARWKEQLRKALSGSR